MEAPMLFPYWAFISLTALEDEKKLNCYEVSSILYYTVEICSFLLRMDDWTCILPCAPSREPVSVLLLSGTACVMPKSDNGLVRCAYCRLSCMETACTGKYRIGPIWTKISCTELWRVAYICML